MISLIKVFKSNKSILWLYQYHIIVRNLFSEHIFGTLADFITFSEKMTHILVIQNTKSYLVKKIILEHILSQFQFITFSEKITHVGYTIY